MPAKKKRKTARRFAFLFLAVCLLCELLSLGSTNRALAGASTALDAGLSVDNELAVTLGDGLNGASCYASAAGYAIIGNLVCHVFYPPFTLVSTIVAYFRQKANTFCKKP